MTSNNQVSPVIRISRGERDASARATHLKAASKKYLETTIERKQMSTTTNFKRIALVAVAALGLGVLNSVPSQAVLNADSVTLSSATASQTTAETYTATSAVVTVSFFGPQNDSMSITAALTAAPAGNTALPTLRLVETSSASVDTLTTPRTTTGVSLLGDTQTSNSAAFVRASAPSVVTTAKFAVYLTSTNGSAAPTVAGTYSVKITPASGGTVSGPLQGSTAQTLTITVTTAAIASTTPDVASSKVFIQGGGNVVPTTDSVVVVTREVAATARGYVYYSSVNAAGGAVSESITAEISGPGTLGLGSGVTSSGRSISVKNGETVTIWSDGTAGKSTITIKGSTSGVTLGTKTATFFGPTASFTAAAGKAILAVGANEKAITFTAADSAANVLNDEFTPTGGTQQVWYAYSSDTTVATVGTLAYSVDSGTVSVTGVKAGTATITIGNAATLAASTIKSAPVTLRVGSTAISSVKVAFDKASYAPGEKAIITVAAYDATNLLVVPGTYELFATGKVLATDKNFSQGTFAAAGDTSLAFASATSAGVSTAGFVTYTVYMPSTPGTVTLTGTLANPTGSATDAAIGTLSTVAAIQGTKITASAAVTDSGSAALAAVTALATTVASLRTLIVTLTNLVLKIQKKVKA
jgi:trimeric autotransporter adhesin